MAIALWITTISLRIHAALRVAKVLNFEVAKRVGMLKL